MYKLTCPNCKKAYIGQTEMNFTIRDNEHKRAFRNNSHSSRFAQHLNEYIHSFRTINTTMQVLHFQKKCSHLNTIECFYIHIQVASNNHLNNSLTVFPNLWHHPKNLPTLPPSHTTFSISINTPSVQHTTQHLYNDTSVPQEIDVYARHCPLLTAGNNLTIFEKLFQTWFL